MKSLRDARYGQWRMLMVSRLVRFVRAVGCGRGHASVVDGRLAALEARLDAAIMFAHRWECPCGAGSITSDVTPSRFQAGAAGAVTCLDCGSPLDDLGEVPMLRREGAEIARRLRVGEP